MAETVELGTGTLGWASFERQSDRYGEIHLNYGKEGAPTFKGAPVGSVGTLSAEVVEVKDFYQTHLAEPKPGEVIKLGVGELFTNEYPRTKYDARAFVVGVKPLDGRKEGWMDSEALYRCDHQVVKLLFTPTA